MASYTTVGEQHEGFTLSQVEEKALKDLTQINWGLMILLGITAVAFFALFGDLITPIINIITVILIFWFNRDLQELDPFARTALTVIYSIMLFIQIMVSLLFGQIGGILSLIFLVRALGLLQFNDNIKDIFG